MALKRGHIRIKTRGRNKNKQKNKKGAVQISFSLLFAIVVGAAILFVAIYAAGKILNLGEKQTSAESAKEIGILFNPLESSFTTATATSFSVSIDTRIYNSCDENSGSIFGSQKISVSQKTLNKWPKSGLNVSFENKYIFSENPAEGTKFYLFSKPFEMPFKVADLIYLTSSSKKYCFIGLPEDWDIRSELSFLNSSNPQLILDNCPAGSIKICVNANSGSTGAGCDITINGDETSGYVQKKNGDRVDYAGSALMIAAVFSDKQIYECQLKRLMQRTEEIANLYSEKETIVKKEGCDSNLGSKLSNLVNLAKNFQSSQSLESIQTASKEIYDLNDEAICRLW